MGKSKKALVEYIESIPDDKLKGFQSNRSNVHKNVDFRLDMEGITSNEPRKYNLQVQVNYGCTITSMARLAPDTVAAFLVPVDMSLSPSQIREGLIAGTIYW